MTRQLFYYRPAKANLPVRFPAFHANNVGTGSSFKGVVTCRNSNTRGSYSMRAEHEISCRHAACSTLRTILAFFIATQGPHKSQWGVVGGGWAGIG